MRRYFLIAAAAAAAVATTITPAARATALLGSSISTGTSTGSSTGNNAAAAAAVDAIRVHDDGQNRQMQILHGKKRQLPPLPLLDGSTGSACRKEQLLLERAREPSGGAAGGVPSDPLRRRSGRDSALHDSELQLQLHQRQQETCREPVQQLLEPRRNYHSRAEGTETIPTIKPPPEHIESDARLEVQRPPSRRTDRQAPEARQTRPKDTFLGLVIAVGGGALAFAT